MLLLVDFLLSTAGEKVCICELKYTIPTYMQCTILLYMHNCPHALYTGTV